MGISSEIMNIQTGDIKTIMQNFYITSPDEFDWERIVLAYKIGHRDARHAASELSLKSERIITEYEKLLLEIGKAIGIENRMKQKIEEIKNNS